MSNVPDGKSQADLVSDVQTHADDPILNQATVAAAMGVAKSTVHRWLAEGAIEAVPNPKGILKVRKSIMLNFLRSSKWAGDEDVFRRLNEAGNEPAIAPSDEIKTEVEEQDDGNSALVGNSGGGQASVNDNHRRNRRDR